MPSITTRYSNEVLYFVHNGSSVMLITNLDVSLDKLNKVRLPEAMNYSSH